ncbi:PLP-dependent aminotransferase family protein [Dyadobacter sp. CY345]|uniref:MocR-like pyridoxine biosynthesis transcription factor PdxR n=1 Tax=Dyadobacter sp. CY345 TaxID=2909335 RepID=UPI001F26983C|nr:PLP-dependent aminotransferase family protein [Dyadobacter sp. CY345]MCF2444137.1 PLP-dependent aminotransferase family protein [Dyadobacter sp. CY345]
MQPISSELIIDKLEKLPVYLQIANQLTDLIRKGIMQSGQQLPSSRQLADALNIHRKTVVRAYDELLAQGWLESKTGSGTFVAKHFPEINPQPLNDNPDKIIDTKKFAGFSFEDKPHLHRGVLKNASSLRLDDGFPDPRIAPLEELSRAYRTQLITGNSYVKLGYGDTAGSYWLRRQLSTYLNETRGLKTGPENILIVRGTVMGLYLSSTGLLNPGDNVALTELGWSGARMNFMQAGANILQIPVDEHGIIVDALDDICKKIKLRMLYVTSHHHYPTTVALRADRRLQLLALSEKYGFIIFEDDYDYDFHYLSRPLLPLAGADQAGMVLYCGSFTKTISPAFRVGYLVGPENVIKHLSLLRRIIDRQGDTMLENAMAELLQNGIIQRHLRKSLRTYRQRRDVICSLLHSHLSDFVQFQIPDGGMAVWTKFDKNIDLEKLAQKALKTGLYFSDGAESNLLPERLNATRFGFASSTVQELEQSVEILTKLLKNQ